MADPDERLAAPESLSWSVRIVLLATVILMIALFIWMLPSRTGGSSATVVADRAGDEAAPAAVAAAGQVLRDDAARSVAEGAGEPLAATEVTASGETMVKPVDGALAIHELSAMDNGIDEVLGGRIALVSSTEPGMLMFEDGQRFGSGARMPNGHVIASIEREKIVLERDGIISVVRLP